MTEWKTHVHKLRHPIQHDGKVIAAVTLREPDVEALEQIDAIGLDAGTPVRVGQLRAIIAALSDVPADVIGKLHRQDFQDLGAACLPLLDPTAEMPSSSS